MLINGSFDEDLRGRLRKKEQVAEEVKPTSTKEGKEEQYHRKLNSRCQSEGKSKEGGATRLKKKFKKCSSMALHEKNLSCEGGLTGMVGQNPRLAGELQQSRRFGKNSRCKNLAKFRTPFRIQCELVGN